MSARGKRVNTPVLIDSEAIDHPGLERWRGATDERLDNIDDSLNRLETSIRNGIESLTKTVSEALGRIEKSKEEKDRDFDARLRKLEDHSNYSKGKLALASVLVGAAAYGLFQALWPLILRAVVNQ